MSRRPVRALCALTLVGAALLGGCSKDGEGIVSVGSDASESPTPGDPTSADDGSSAEGSYAVEAPGPLRDSLLKPDVLITGEETLPDELVERIADVKGVQATLPISVASASVEGKTLTVAAVDPGEFRRFTPEPTARADFVWERLAGGEVAVDASVSKKLIGEGDMVRLGGGNSIPDMHVGAYAPLITRFVGIGEEVPAIHAVVNAKRGEQLGLPTDNALLVNTGQTTPSKLDKEFKRILGDTAATQTLALELDVGPQVAILTGASVSDAIGTFSYTNGPDGTINPDPAWVREYIRTEEVPILGEVTCNKAYLPQLRGALDEIVRLGLSEKIHPEEYAGCYYPRYIGRDPSNGLSLHSWGIAVDLNVPGNLRGTRGEIDRRVVAIMKKWGMDWGGDWSYTDPMHFEMSSVVRVGG